MRLVTEILDGIDYAGIASTQPEGVDLQSSRAAVLGLNVNRLRELRCQRRLTNARPSMQDNDRRQLRGRAYDLHFSAPGVGGDSGHCPRNVRNDVPELQAARTE